MTPVEVPNRLDLVCGSQFGVGLQALNPLVETCSIAAPHLVLQTQPKEAAAVVLEFIRRTTPNHTAQTHS